MSRSGLNSSTLSSPPPSSPEQFFPAASSLPSQVPDSATRTTQNDLSIMASSESLSQTQQPQPQVPASVSMTAPTFNMAAKRVPRLSPKRDHEEEDDEEEEAFGTPPPKRTAKKASKAGNGKTAPKRVAAPKKSAPKKAMPEKTPAKKTATVPPPPSSRPLRNRKAPERFGDLEEKPTPQALPTKKAPSKVFDPDYVTTNSSSRLVKADIYHMLLEGPAWTSLSVEQQSTLISMLPQDTANQALLAKISAGETEETRPSAFTLANNCFRTDVAKFQEDLKNGHLAKTWQAAAKQAVIERAAGEYDEWKAAEAESWWGQKSK